MGTDPVAEDMRDLINRFADHPSLKDRPSYQAMVTVFGRAYFQKKAIGNAFG
jgi:hypothetical protein